MKTKIILTVVISILIFSACKKDNTTAAQETPTYPIEGLWTGTFNVNNDPSQPGDYFYSFSIFSDGSVLTKSYGADGNYYYNSGTWSLSADTLFRATITSINYPGPAVTERITGTFSDTGVIKNGTWMDIANGSSSGHFSTMKRVN